MFCLFVSELVYFGTVSFSESLNSSKINLYNTSAHELISKSDINTFYADLGVVFYTNKLLSDQQLTLSETNIEWDRDQKRERVTLVPGLLQYLQYTTMRQTYSVTQTYRRLTLP